MNPEYFINEALEASKRAIDFDNSGNHESAAAYFYRIAADLLDQAIDVVQDEKNKCLWKEKAEKYRERASHLESIYDQRQISIGQQIHDKQLSKCYFLFDQGLRADEAGEKDKAVEFYTQAVEAGIEFKCNDEERMKKIKNIAYQALERAEELKGIKKQTETYERDENVESLSNLNLQTSSSRNIPCRTLHRGSSAHLEVSGENKGYSDEEKRVLLLTSEINGIKYVPFMIIDLNEQFRYPIPFTDRDGKLKLSPKQKRDFIEWIRPDSICADPKMVSGATVDCFNIKQTVISDCSFVASLAVSALYEKRFNRPLITSIIYPRDSKNNPVYNPFGKYMVKLHLNGVPRKILIDDYLPVGKHGQLLCSYSNNKNEFWVSLLEKAYMKVMGGYDFPGSNSNIDLHALTGWIPERIAIKNNDETFNKTAIFDMLLSRLAQGHVLLTVATGEISDHEANRSGLVSTHAYAVLDIKSIDGIKLFLLKNPWSHVRWKGNYSELDTVHWTTNLKSQLSYDPYSVSEFDNGVFWIDYESICNFFDVFYLSWNPELFNYTYCIHQMWQAGIGPIRDAYNIGENPQFSLETEKSSGAIWILLTRHIMQIEDFKENKEYITVLVYKNDGKRVYYPYDPEPYIDGIRINSPHYLCKIKYGPESPRKYTLVVSQYEKMHTIYYTLRAYSTCPFKLKKIQSPYVKKETVSGTWDLGKTASGCQNHVTYRQNPKIRVVVDGALNDNKIYIDLKGPKEYQIGFDVVITKVNDETITAPFSSRSSGPFRSGFVYLELDNIPSGHLEIIPSTYLPNCEGPFILTVKASCNFQIERIR